MMKGSKWILSAGLFCVRLAGLPSPGEAAATLSADDFLPIVQAPEEQRGELSAVRQPDAVKTEADAVLEQPVTSAATVQDAINAVVAERKQGCTMIAVPSGGYGFVATGIGTYRKNMDNITAERIAQRNAYVEAYMQAKSQMASLLGEMAVKGVTTFDRKTETLDTDSKALRNQTRDLNEHQKAVVYGVLKGYVTYEVHDDIDKGIVYVTLVSTPRTRGQYARPDSDTLIAATLNEGLNTMLSEIQNNLVPPVGGRIIDVPTTGEVAFVGFGSAVVRKDKDPALQKDLTLSAERTAELRASDALCGIITGEKVSAASALDESTQTAVRDFETIAQRDPTTGVVSQVDVANAEGRKKEFRSRQTFQQTIESARQGLLPPGVQRRTWTDKDEAFAWGIAVYAPSLTDAAAAGARDMENAQIVQPVQPKQAPQPESSDKLEQGVSGTVKQEL